MNANISPLVSITCNSGCKLNAHILRIIFVHIAGRRSHPVGTHLPLALDSNLSTLDHGDVWGLFFQELGSCVGTQNLSAGGVGLHSGSNIDSVTKETVSFERYIGEVRSRE